MREIVPVHQIKRRIPEQGRIRMGEKGTTVKNGKTITYPKRLTRFRFTSADKPALDTIAELYGGTVTAWDDKQNVGHHQVTVTQEKIPVVLPPDPLSGTPIYELWSGGGCQRRCDGIECALEKSPDAKPDDAQPVAPCLCRANGLMLCKATTRLNVILREIPFGGTWRLESKGWNSAEELPGMVAAVLAVQESGFTVAELAIGQRSKITNGKTSRYVVPALTLPESVEALAEGRMRLTALGRLREIATDTLHMDRPALNAGQVAPPAPPPVDDGTVDAEWFFEELDEPPDSLDERPGTSTGTADEPPPPVGGPAFSADERAYRPETALHVGIAQVVEIPEVAAASATVNDFRHALVLLVTKDRSPSSKDLAPLELSAALALVADLLAGDRRWVGIENGRLRVSGRRVSDG